MPALTSGPRFGRFAQLHGCCTLRMFLAQNSCAIAHYFLWKKAWYRFPGCSLVDNRDAAG